MTELADPALPQRRLAVDLGGTWLRATTAEAGLSRALRRRVGPATTAQDLAAAMWELAEALDPHLAAAVDELVIAVPTFSDATGTLLDCPALPALTGVRLPDVVAGHWSAVARASAPSVHVVPDVAAATIGEARLGSGRGVDRFLCVALGTGANAAASVRGVLITTAHGCLGDAGHVVIEPDGLACTCGGRGCLETRTSGWALGREAGALGLADAAELAVAARAGDPRARAAFDRAGLALGCAMASWSVLVWPDVIAVAGGLSGASDLLLEPARVALARHAPPYVAARIQVVRAELGTDAALAGCLTLVTGA